MVALDLKMEQAHPSRSSTDLYTKKNDRKFLCAICTMSHMEFKMPMLVHSVGSIVGSAQKKKEQVQAHGWSIQAHQFPDKEASLESAKKAQQGQQHGKD